MVRAGYSFPMAAVADCRELGDLQQQKGMLSQTWRSEVHDQFLWAKYQGDHRAVQPQEALRENLSLASCSSWWLPTFLGL